MSQNNMLIKLFVNHDDNDDIYRVAQKVITAK